MNRSRVWEFAYIEQGLKPRPFWLIYFDSQEETTASNELSVLLGDDILKETGIFQN